jgi:hypothetical protein
MKIRIPFKMFGKEGGEIELNISVDSLWVKNHDEIKELAIKDAESAGRYLGIFRDKFQKIILGYERVPGIENVYETLKLCSEDDILRERLLELARARREKVISSYDEE